MIFIQPTLMQPGGHMEQLNKDKIWEFQLECRHCKTQMKGDEFDVGVMKGFVGTYYIGCPGCHRIIEMEKNIPFHVKLKIAARHEREMQKRLQLEKEMRKKIEEEIMRMREEERETMKKR